MKDNIPGLSQMMVFEAARQYFGAALISKIVQI